MSDLMYIDNHGVTFAQRIALLKAAEEAIDNAVQAVAKVAEVMPIDDALAFVSVLGLMSGKLTRLRRAAEALAATLPDSF